MEMRLERITMLTLMMMLSPRPFRRKRQRREKGAVAAKAPATGSVAVFGTEAAAGMSDSVICPDVDFDRTGMTDNQVRKRVLREKLQELGHDPAVVDALPE